MERFNEIQDGIYEDQETGLQWTKTFCQMSWQDAADFCKTLNIGGHSDWKLPNLQELISIKNISIGYPVTDLAKTKTDKYWSSTDVLSSTATMHIKKDKKWYVKFGYDYIDVGFLDKLELCYVRAVRGGQ